MHAHHAIHDGQPADDHQRAVQSHGASRDQQGDARDRDDQLRLVQAEQHVRGRQSTERRGRDLGLFLCNHGNPTPPKKYAIMA